MHAHLKPKSYQVWLFFANASELLRHRTGNPKDGEWFSGTRTSGREQLEGKSCSPALTLALAQEGRGKVV